MDLRGHVNEDHPYFGPPCTFRCIDNTLHLLQSKGAKSSAVQCGGARAEARRCYWSREYQQQGDDFNQNYINDLYCVELYFFVVWYFDNHNAVHGLGGLVWLWVVPLAAPKKFHNETFWKSLLNVFCNEIK